LDLDLGCPRHRRAAKKQQQKWGTGCQAHPPCYQRGLDGATQQGVEA
jgi:hypothetical protein